MVSEDERGRGHMEGGKEERSQGGNEWMLQGSRLRGKVAKRKEKRRRLGGSQKKLERERRKNKESEE